MRKHYDQHPDPEDMFADTRMTFGEHIEDLRTHLLRAIYGFLVGMIIAFCIGKPVLRFIASPVERQLKSYWNRFYEEKRREIVAASRSGVYEGKTFVMPLYRLDLHRVAKGLNIPPPEEKFIELFPPQERPDLVLDLRPAFREAFEGLGLGDASKVSTRYIDVEPDPGQFAEALTQFNLAMKPPTLATLSVQEAFVVFFKVSLMTGLVISSPWVFLQVWLFIAAGLYPHEKRLVNVYMPFSLGLFLVGVFVCEFFVIPKAIEALLWFNEWLGLQPDLRLSEWLGFAIMMPLVFGLSFQTPLIMLFAERVGVMTVETYREKWKVAMIAIVIFSAIITPSTDAVSMLLLAGPMYLLYELGIILCKLQGPRARFDDWETEESQEMVEV